MIQQAISKHLEKQILAYAKHNNMSFTSAVDRILRAGLVAEVKNRDK